MNSKKWSYLLIFSIMIITVMVLYVTVLEATPPANAGVLIQHGKVWVGERTSNGSSWQAFSCTWCHDAKKVPTMDKKTDWLHLTKNFPKYRVKLSDGQEIRFGKGFIRWERKRLHVLDRTRKLYKTLPSGTLLIKAKNGGMGIIFPVDPPIYYQGDLVSVFKGVVK